MTKKTIHHFLILAVAPFLAFAAPAAASDDRGTPEEAQDMVARAIAYYDEMGGRGVAGEVQCRSGAGVPGPRPLHLRLWA